MELEISAERKLAKEDPVKVMGNLEKNGFHLQLSDKTSIEELMAQIAGKKI